MAIKKIRRGKTLNVSWKITTNSEDIPLSGRDLKLHLTCNKQFSKELNFSIKQRNVITTTIQGTDLRQVGVYRLTLWENFGLNNQTVVDADTFQIVERTYEENNLNEIGNTNEGLDIDTVNLDPSDIEVLGGIGIADIVETISYDDFGENIITFVTNGGKRYNVVIHNGRKGDKGDAFMYSDFTKEQIAELQKPSFDMISVLEATNNAVNDNEDIRNSNEDIRNSNEEARQANTANAIKCAEYATDKANEVAAHPTFVGTDHYVYEYNLANHEYVKTEKMVKAAAFKIDEIYSSIDELLAHQPIGKMDGLFAVINTEDTEDEDNAKLFISKDGVWQYIVDMSGFRGFRGYVPQLFKGEVENGKNKDDADFYITEIGKDDEGNPKYKVDIKLPTFVYDDFTDEQILELQKPAIDKSTEVQAEEEKRVIAEQERVEAENHRIDNEVVRESNENERLINEEGRVKEEERRVKEIDELIKRLQALDVALLKERLNKLEQNALIFGEIVGYDDDVDTSVFEK